MTVQTQIRTAIPAADKTPKRIVLLGGSGQVGTLLARHFHQHGEGVCVVARTTYSAPWRVAAWNGQRLGQWVNMLDGADVVINLAGRSVDCRYNARNREEILQSRLKSTRLVGEAIRRASTPPAIWINASTATIYRHALERPMDEEQGELGGNEPGAPDTWRFSIEVATRWEETFFAAETPSTRKVALRSAMTMSPDRGGVFAMLLRLVRFGLGGQAGSGEQFVSWIHERDLIRAVEFLIANPHIEGAVNASAPNPVTNAEFMMSLRKAWGTSVGLSATGWMLEFGAFLLRTETELILKSRRVVPGRLTRAGFAFEFPEWPEAAKDLVKSWRERRKGDPNHD